MGKGNLEKESGEAAADLLQVCWNPLLAESFTGCEILGESFCLPDF
jgi:hypothetical protein